jgi:integrase
MPATGAGIRGRLRWPADRGAGRATPKPRRPVGRAVTVAEILTEVNGKLITGPPKTRADRRTVGLPPFVAGELEAHLAAAQRPGSHVFTAPGGGPLRVPSFRARFWVPATKAAGLQGRRIHDLRHTAVALWMAAGATPKEVTVRRAHLGQLHPGPLRPPEDPRPVAGGRCHPVRD